MINKNISHYRILEKLGEGGMGVVYKAEDTKLKRMVALKFLPRELIKDDEAKERFFTEAQASAALNHPNIVTIHEINEHDDQVYIVMELVEGENLKQRIKPGPLEIDEVLKIANQLARGLEEAHKKEIIHRDIKSANIMVTDSGQVKILDFGLARLKNQTGITKVGTTLGTTAYMSPEQTQGAAVDHRSDIWSMGVVLYELLTGETPFKGEYEQAVIYSILNEEPESISFLRSDVPEELEQIIKRMLVKEPEKRYQTATHFLQDLKMLKEDSGSEVSPSRVKTNTEYTSSKWRKKSHYIYAGFTLIIVLFILFNFLYSPIKDHKNSITKIAVLPFLNMKKNPETDYLGFVLADQIIGDLVYLKNIIVRPSSSIRKFENQLIEPIKIGYDLKVDYVLTGNYLKEKKDIRLNVELIKVKTNEMIWRDRIEIKYKNTFKLQDIVSDKVIKGLSIQFTQDERDLMRSNTPKNSLSYEYYLRSISYPHTNKGDQLAIEMLKKSIELDPDFAPAYDQLGFRIKSLAQFGLQNPEETKRAEEYFKKALILNSMSVSALGNLSILYTETARIEEAVTLTKKMLKINPNNAIAHFSLGVIYRYAGMLNESVKEMETAISIDPKNPKFRSLGVTYINVEKYEKAFKAFYIDKKSVYSLGWQGIVLFRQGNKKQAVKYFDRVITSEPEGLWGLVAVFFKATIQGDKRKGLAAMHKLEQANIKDAEAWYFWASHYALLDDSIGCIRTLNRAIDSGYFNYPFMLTDLFLDSVRKNPEFQKVLEKARIKHLNFKKRFF